VTFTTSLRLKTQQQIGNIYRKNSDIYNNKTDISQNNQSDKAMQRMHVSHAGRPRK